MTTTTPDTGEPTGYAAVAAEQSSHAYALHRMGEALRDLPDFRDTWICIQPGLPDAADENRATVDAIARALFGKDGADEVRKDGTAVHDADGRFGPIRVSITAVVPGPVDLKDAEIERLRAELAEARAATANAEAHLGTNGAVAEAKPDTYGLAVTGRATVPTPDGGCE
jgi:hypothetical protein